MQGFLDSCLNTIFAKPSPQNSEKCFETEMLVTIQFRKFVLNPGVGRDARMQSFLDSRFDFIFAKSSPQNSEKCFETEKLVTIQFPKFVRNPGVGRDARMQISAKYQFSLASGVQGRACPPKLGVGLVLDWCRDREIYLGKTGTRPGRVSANLIRLFRGSRIFVPVFFPDFSLPDNLQQ